MTVPAPSVLITSPFLTSVTKTGRDVVVVVMTADPFMPGFSALRGTRLPSTVNRKSSGTVCSWVAPSAPRTTRVLPSTEITSKDFTSRVVEVWAPARPVHSSVARTRWIIRKCLGRRGIWLLL